MITKEQAIDILKGYQDNPAVASDEDQPTCVLSGRRIESGELYFRLKMNDSPPAAVCAESGDEYAPPVRRIGQSDKLSLPRGVMYTDGR